MSVGACYQKLFVLSSSLPVTRVAWAIVVVCVLGPGAVMAEEPTEVRSPVSGEVGLEQMTVGRSGVSYAQSLVSCPAGWVRSGCSGGVSGTSERDTHAIPVGPDSCRFSGNTNRSGYIYIHCMRFGSLSAPEPLFADGFEEAAP